MGGREVGRLGWGGGKGEREGGKGGWDERNGVRMGMEMGRETPISVGTKTLSSCTTHQFDISVRALG